MLTMIQRVTSAQVSVNDVVIANIKVGILALVAIEKNDTEKEAQKLLDRILNYRIFADANERMNLSLKDIKGGLLLVPQFTLAADTSNGNRPSFTPAAAPEKGLQLFNFLQQLAVSQYQDVAFGQFGADMQVTLINNGPATFNLKV
ncbi:MAG: D-aminoacyl-tRNA deacylase [Methylococcaceae bacterium]|jgi:D-tyrosyl-tRNA(Tyr) deacylase